MNTIGVTEREVVFAPPPAWADTPAFDPAASSWAGEALGGVRYRLADDQVKAGDGPQVAVVRRIMEVLSPDGLSGVSSVEVVFDPAREQAAVHFVRVIRGGRTRELPLAGAFEVFRRERDMERAMFDGRLTAHMIIPDLRVGDIVDYCYSITGENPALRGLIGQAPSFQWGVAVETVRFRLMTPAGRVFKIRYWGARPQFEEKRHDGYVDRIWTAERAAAFHFEPGAPPEWSGHSRAVMAESTTWPRIAAIFRDAYAPPARLPEGLEALADDIARKHASPAERVAEALRLAQREVRYLAISIGEGGLLPRPVEDIWASRFGDCKDSSRLLTALLQRLGVEAAPALVNTVIGHGLGDYPPTTIAFNHCIVRVRLDGRTWWLDPTRSPQSGRLDRLTQARFGWALPLVPGAELEAMGEDEPATVLELKYDIRFGDGARSPARLEVRSILRAWRADDLRRRLANDGREAVARSYREFYENRFGPVREVSPIAVTDRPDDNEAETHEVFDLLEPWRLTEDGRTLYFNTADEVIAPDFHLARTPERRAPIYAGWPRRMTQETTLHLPRVWNVNAYDDVWKAGPVEVRAGFRQDDGGRTAHVHSSIVVAGRAIPAAEARAYFDMAERGRASAAITLTHAAVDGEFVPMPVSYEPPDALWKPAPKRKRVQTGEGMNWFAVVWVMLILLYLVSKLGAN